MKRTLLLLMSFVLVMASSCNSQQEDYNLEQDASLTKSRADLIHFGTKKEMSEFSKAEMKLYQVAYEKMDKIVAYDGKEYFVTTDYNESIGISEEVFDYFVSKIKATNMSIKGLSLIETAPNVLEVVSPEEKLEFEKGLLDSYGPPVMITQAAEDGPGNPYPGGGGGGGGDVSNPGGGNNPGGGGTSNNGGVTKIEYYWFGVKLYVSNKVLTLLGMGASQVTLIAGLVPEPIFTKLTMFFWGATAISASYEAYCFPRGVIYTFDLSLWGENVWEPLLNRESQ